MMGGPAGLEQMAAMGMDLNQIQDRLPSKSEQLRMYSLNIALQAMRSDTSVHPPLDGCETLVREARRVYHFINTGNLDHGK